MKLTEKELNEFPIGTKIYIDYKYPFIKNEHDSWVCFVNDTTRGYWNENVLTQDVVRVEIPTYTEYIPPQPILDDKEKEYLSNVIRPWKKRIKIIAKHRTGRYEWIVILNKNGENMSFPAFKTGTMYKDMELDREYSLEELGL